MTSFRGLGKSKENDIIRFDVDASFTPKDAEDLSSLHDERNSRIVLSTRVGRGVLAVDVPVMVKNIGFSATVSLQLQTQKQIPFIKLLHVNFTEAPHVEFALKPLKGLDVMDLPGLNQFLHNLIRDILSSLFVPPNTFTLDVDALVNGEWASAE